MITNLTLENFLLFKKADFQFGERLNVIIGGNASGKTQLLKLLFTLGDGVSAHDMPSRKRISNLLLQVFRVRRLNELLQYNPQTQSRAMRGTLKLQGRTDIDERVFQLTIDAREENIDEYLVKEASSLYFVNSSLSTVVYLPARELLTLYKNFHSLNDRYQLPYDATYSDTMLKLGMPYLRRPPQQFIEIIEKLEQAIDGKIFLDNEQFYYRFPNQVDSSNDMDVNMAAEGWRKLAMLLQLLKNGELHEGMTLIWDEPDANLNPQFIGLIALALVELSKRNIQVFLSTHCLYLLDELEIILLEQKLNNGIRYFNFHKDQPIQQGNKMAELKNVLALDEDLELSERYLAMEER